MSAQRNMDLRDAPSNSLSSTVVRVGFWSPVFMPIGGTETVYKTLVPRLAKDPRIKLTGFAVLEPNRCDHSVKLGCPLVTGEKGLRAVAAESDVLVMWAIPEPGRFLKPKGNKARPMTVAISHDDLEKPWFADVMSAYESDMDRFVAVHVPAMDSIPPSRIEDATVIFNAIDPERLKPGLSRDDARASLGLETGQVAILYLARVSEEKHPCKTIEAVKALPANCVLLMAGDGPESRACAELAKGDARIKLLGKRLDVGNLFAAADLFVSMSRSEGFGLSAAEAMLAGVPVISTPVGFLAESPDLARVVPIAADAMEWAKAIEADWLETPRRTARASVAREAISTRYGVDAHVEQWSDLLCSLGTERRRAMKPRVPLGTRHCIPCGEKK